jgi:acetyltransferase-like isoleucine patch superfamily enzyme
MSFTDKLKLFYGWIVRVGTGWMPDIPVCQSFRGWMYSFAMKKCGFRFRVCHNVILNRLELMEVGNNVYFGPGSVVSGGGDIIIGDNVLVGPNVVFSAANHKFDGKTFVNGYVFGKIIVGNDVWIGSNVSLLMGAVIPDSSIVGAGSVFNKSFEKPFSLYAGVPATYIKSIAD